MELDNEPHSSGPAAQDDLSDEPQDFRFLSSLHLKSDHPTLPRRGEKDFEPHGTVAQRDVLDAARAAMHEALSVRRAHPPDSRPVGFLDLRILQGRNEDRVTDVVVPKPRGAHFRVMGHADHKGLVHLKPEEALYLTERGTMELRLLGVGKAHTEKSQDPGDEGMLLSVQSAYALLLGRDGLTLERFQVYAGLRRSGYIVQRAPDWHGRAGQGGGGAPAADEGQKPQRYLDWLLSTVTGLSRSQTRPMVGVGLYRSHAGIYAQLSRVPRVVSKPSEQTSQPQTGPPQDQISITYNVWKPNARFKKSEPGLPDFQIAVIAAEPMVNEVFTPAQLNDLFAALDERPPPPQTAGHMYQRLRHGQKHVILAIVEQGVISYLRVADSDFAKEKLYLSMGPKTGAKGKGSGRGRERAV